MTTSSEGDEPNRYVVVEPRPRRVAAAEDWLRAVVETPGLTALDLAAARAGAARRTRSRALPVLERVRGADRRCRLGERLAGDPDRCSRSRSARSCCSRRSGRKCDFLEQLGAGERARCPGPRRGAGARLGGRRAREGTRPAAGRGRVVPAARPGRAALPCSGSARAPISSGSRASRGRLAAELVAWLRRARRAAKDGPDARRLPAPHRRGAQSGRSPESPSVLASSLAAMSGQGLCVREPEGRRRQDDDRRQPRRLPRRGRRARARRRPRPAGERDLGARDEGERHLELRPARRRPARASSRSRPRSRTSSCIPSKPELAGAAVELARRADGEGFLAESLATRAGLRLRAPRLPALARPADGERARRRRPGDRPGSGRVLRARGARAADAVDQPRSRPG